MSKLPFSSRTGATLLALFLAGCDREPDLPPVIGADGQSQARAAFEQLVQTLDAGNPDKVWDGLSERSRYRIKENLGAGGKKSPGEKAVELLRGMVGRKPVVKEARGTRSGVEIEFEYATGKTRELEMVSEGGAWKLNLFSS